CLIGEILREMVLTLLRLRWVDEVVVLDEIGVPVVRLAAEEPVEPVEALLKRPFRSASAARDVFGGDIVVFPQPERAVPVVLQYLTDRRALRGQAARGAGESVCRLSDRSEAIDVVVSPREERGARRRAERRRVPLRV